MNTPAIRVIGPSGSGRSAIAAALHKLLKDNGVASDVINCAVDEKSWKLELKSMLRGKLLPIIVSPNRHDDDIPATMELMKELAAARKSAQDARKKCQQLEVKLVAEEHRTAQLTFGNEQYNTGYAHGVRKVDELLQKARADMQKEFDSKLAAYKDATRSEMKALSLGSVPDAFIASHTNVTGVQSSRHIILSYHRPSENEVREVCGYPGEGGVTCGPLLVPLVPPRVK